MRGIKFNDKTSGQMGALVQVTSLPLLPEKRKNEIEIPGMDGALDFGGHTFAKKIITADVTVIGATRSDLIMKTRLLANWLAPKGVLSLAEEPNVYYVAEIFNIIDRNKLLGLSNVATFPITFEAEPYAYIVYPDGAMGYPVINSLQDLMNSNYDKIL